MKIRSHDGRDVEIVVDDDLRVTSGYCCDDGTALTPRECKEIEDMCEGQIYEKWLARQNPGQKKSGQGPIK